MLKEIGVPVAGCIIHCYTEDAELARAFVDVGCHISFAGPLTFKKAENIREAARAVPLSRILVETDSPFLAPEPHRGKTNEPAFVAVTAARLAEARGEDTQTIAAATMSNARSILDRVRST